MGESVGVAQLDLELNEAGFKRNVNSFSKRAGSMLGGAFKAIGAAFVAKELFDFGKGGVQLASDLQEVQNVVDVTFRDMAGDVNEFSKNALNDFGLSELSAKKYASTMGAMLKSSGLAGDKMKEMSLSLTGLAGDIASFYNLKTDDAFYKLQAGISGEIEPLRRLGINLTQANVEAWALSKGIKVNMQQMDFASQATLRYQYVLEATKDAQGDFIRTQGSWANQTRLLSEQWKIFQGTLGAGFMNILTPVIKMLNTLISRLQIAAQYFKSFTQLLFGQAQAAGTAASNVLNMNDATEGAGASVKKAGKEVKGSLSGFDQLNILSQDAANAMDTIADDAANVGDMNAPELSTDSPTLDIDVKALQPISDILAKLKEDAMSVGQFLINAFGPPLRQSLDSLILILSAWKTSFIGVFSDIGSLFEPFKNYFVNSLIPAWQQIIPIASGIFNGLLDSARIVFQGIWDAAFPVIQWFVSDGLPLLADFGTGCWKVFESFFNYVKNIFDTLWSGAVQPGLSVLSNMIVDTLNLIKNFWDKWSGGIVQGFIDAFNGLSTTFANWWNTIFKPIWDKLLNTLTWLWDKHLKGLVQEFLNFVGKLVTGALEIYNKFILPMINWFVNTFGPGISSAFQTVIDVVGTVIAVISDVVKGIIKALGGIIDFIVGVFTGNWKKAWQGVKDIFVGIFDIIVGVLKGAINLIIDGINGMIRGLNRIKFDIPEWVPLLGGKKFGIDIPAIPKLAQGGLISSPMLAMVGDNRNAQSDPEVVSPLSKLQEMLDFSNQAVINTLLAILEAIRSDNKQIIIKLGETEFGRAAINAINEVQRQSGKTLLIV